MRNHRNHSIERPGVGLRLVVAASILVTLLGVTGGIQAPPAAAAVDPLLGPVAPANETYCYAAADNGDRLAFIRMVGAPGDPGFTIQVDRLRLPLGRSNVEALAIRPSGGLYAVDDATGSSPLGRVVPGEFDATVDGDATVNPSARGDFVAIANLNRGGTNLDLDVDGLTFIETDNLNLTDDVLLGAVRRTGDDTLVTIDPVTGLTSVEWAITPPSELTTTPDVDGIANIVDNDVDDIGWDPESDIVYGVLGGASLNYLGRLAWVLDDGSGGTTVSTTVPRDGGGAPDFGDVVRLDFVRIGSPAYNDVEGLGFSNVGATFGQFFGVVGDGGADDDEFLAFDKDTGAVTSLIDLRLDPSQGTGDQDYEGVDCVQPVLPGSLTLAELTTPADGTRFTFAGGAYGDIGSGSSADGLADGETETKTVNAGTYVITQDPLSGWSLDDLSCTGDNGFGAGDFTVDLVARTVTVQVDAGQAVTCTYENSKDPVPSISVDKTVYRGHDDGAGCAGEEQVLGVNGDPVTWCFLVTNTGETTLSPVTLDDGPLGIDDTDMDVLVGDLSSLAPGGTATLYVQTAIDGDLANTVVATGTPVDEQGDPLPGGDVTDDDPAAVDEVAPGVLLEKTVYEGHDGGGGCDGADLVTATPATEVTYCFTVTNTGDTRLEPVTIDDPDLGIDDTAMAVASGSPDALDPSESGTWYFETAIAGDLTNTATVTGVPADGNGDPLPGVDEVTDANTASVAEVDPAISVDKTVYRGHDGGIACDGGDRVYGRDGDAVTYCFTVTNRGDATLAPVTLDDVDLGISEADLTVRSGDLASLAPGGTATLYLETTIDGDLVNTVVATGTPVDEQGDPLPTGDVSDDDTAEVDAVDPAIEVHKTVYRGHDDGSGCTGAELVSGVAGDPVTYCFEVRNTGDTTLAPVALDDLDLGVDETEVAVLSGDLGSLPAGAIAEVYVESVIAADLFNTVTVTGTPVNEQGDGLAGVGDVSDDDTAEVDQVAPSVSVAKTVYAGHDDGAGCAGAELVSGLAGDAVTYCFEVENTGDTTLAPVTLDDADLGVDETGLAVVSGDLAAMAPGDVAVLYAEEAIAGDLVNTVVATGMPADGQGVPLPGVEDVTDEDTAEVDELDPSVSVVKTVYAGHDDGAGCAGGDRVTGRAGDPVTYCFEVTNTGDTTLAPVALDDVALNVDESDLDAVSGDLASMAPGDTAVRYLEAVIDGDLVNTAVVTGTPLDGQGDPLPGGDVTDEDTAEVDEVDPSISVAKTVYAGHDDGAGCAGGELVSGLPGDPVTYCVEVTNTGDTTLAPVTLDDASLGIDESGFVVAAGTLASMAPGDVTALYVETDIRGDLLNTVVAAGTPADGQGDPLPGFDDVTDGDTAEVDELGPSVSIDKTVYLGHDGGAGCGGRERVHGRDGDPITYCFEVQNTGDTALAPVTVADLDLDVTQADLEVVSGDLASMGPGDVAMLALESEIDGDLVNTATVTGTPVDDQGDPLPGGDVTDEDTAEVEEVDPSVSVAKTVYAGHDDGAGCAGGELVTGRAGDAVTYCFAVTNTGDTTLAPVTLDDADLGLTGDAMASVSGDLASLAVGQTAVLYAEATLTDDLVNTVVVTGTPVDGQGDPLPGVDDVTDEDTAEVDERAPSVSVAKTVYAGHDDGAGCAGTELVRGQDGDAVTYCFTVTNDGDTTLAPITVDDPDLGIDETDVTARSGDLSALAPGGTAVVYVEATIDGDLVNTVTVTGTPVDEQGDPLPGDDVSDEDTAEVDSVAPSMTLLTEVFDSFSGDWLDADADAGTLGSNDPTRAVLSAGDTASFRFTVTNTGDAGITDVVLDAPQCDEEPVVTSGDTLNAGVLDVGEVWVLACNVSDVVSGFVLDASVAGDAPGGAPAGSGDHEVAGVRVASIVVEKTVADPGTGDFGDSATVEPGADVTFRIVVTNDGEVPLSDVVVADELGPDCARELGDVLEPGDSFAAYTCVVFEVDEGFVNTAVATATPVDDAGDPVGVDVSDEDPATVLVEAPPVTDLAITKDLIAIDQDTAIATWQVTVTNVGDTAATEPIVVTDDLAAGLSYRDAGGDGWLCEYADPAVVCVTDIDLAPGGATSFTIETYVEADPDTTVTNVARVDGNDDTNDDNNTDDAAVVVDSQDDLVPYIPDTLARTGSDLAGLVATGVLLVLAGLGLRRYGRRQEA